MTFHLQKLKLAVNLLSYRTKASDVFYLYFYDSDANLTSFIGYLFKNIHFRDFPGSLVVKTSPSNAGGVGSIPGRGAKIPHASRPKNQNMKQKQYCSKFNKD